jgi:hypothetical protein
MENSIIVGYIVLTEKILDKYGLKNRFMLCGKEDLLRLSQDFDRELCDTALLWLATVIESGRDNVSELVEAVNTINKEQYKRFSSKCKLSMYLTFPFNSVSLN